MRHLVDADECVHLRQQAGQLRAEPLRKASRYHQRLTTRIRFAHFHGFQDGIHALLLRGSDKRAGVDQQRVGAHRIVGDFKSLFQQGPEHDFGVHQILGAPQGDHPNPYGLVGTGFLHSKRASTVPHWNSQSNRQERGWTGMLSRGRTGCRTVVTAIPHYQGFRGLDEDPGMDRGDAAHHFVIDGPD